MIVNKRTIWRICEIAGTELVMMAGMFLLLMVAKAVGISEGKVTKILPFVMILLVTAVVGMRNRVTLKDIGITGTWKTGILSVLFAGIGMLPFLLSKEKTVVLQGITWNIGYYILVGASEELFFRGYIKTRFQQDNVWVWRIVSAFAFAMLHMISSEKMTGILFLLLFAFGMVFAILRDITNSIIPSVCFHAVWDILACYSDAYGNVLWYIGDWILLIVAAMIYHHEQNRQGRSLNGK